MTTPPNSSSSLLDGRQKPPKREDTKNAKNSKSNIVLPPKKPTLSKAERREVQEKQRALKAARQGGASASRASALEGGGVSRNVPPPQPRALSNKSIGGLASMPTSGGGAHSSRNEKTVELFSHLPQYKPRSYNYSVTWAKQAGLVAGKQKEATLHPAILELGIQYREGTIRGANSRCRAMMDVFKVRTLP